MSLNSLFSLNITYFLRLNVALWGQKSLTVWTRWLHVQFCFFFWFCFVFCFFVCVSFHFIASFDVSVSQTFPFLKGKWVRQSLMWSILCFSMQQKNSTVSWTAVTPHYNCELWVRASKSVLDCLKASSLLNISVFTPGCLLWRAKCPFVA